MRKPISTSGRGLSRRDVLQGATLGIAASAAGVLPSFADSQRPAPSAGASAVLTNFLHYALDDDPVRRYRPFVLLGGASGLRSHLALDGLARTLTYEICAVQVGPPVLAAGDLVDLENGVVDPELQQRIERAIQALVAFAGAGVALHLNQAEKSV